MSITLPTIANVALPAGTAVFVPLCGSDPGHTISYSVTASDYSKLTPVVMPQSNKTLQLNVSMNGVDRVMDFQLFDNLAPTTTAHIESLVESGFYDGLSIYRNGKDSGGNPFVIQGGNNPPTGAIKTNPSSIAEEFNPDLRFTSAGLLAMARSSAPGSSSTEFFITEASTRFLDYNYTIFGIQTVGADAISTIAAMPNQDTSLGYLVTPLTITSASIFTDTQNGVLEIRAPAGVSGTVTVTVTVTASDGINSPTTQSFVVTIQSDSTSNPANPFASVTPAAPGSVAFVPPVGDNSHATGLNNSDSSHILQFEVSGVTSGNLVEILADGNVIGQAVASGTTVIVTTDGSTKLTDGLHRFTAIQTAENRTVSVTESGSSTALSKTADVPSLNSLAVQLTVDTAAPQFNFTPITTAVVGVPYTCQVATNPDSGGAVTYQLLQPPTGMGIDSNTGLITWTPTAGQTPTAHVTVQASDPANNTAQQDFTIDVLAANTPPDLIPASPSLGVTDEDTPATIHLATFINNGSGTTHISDPDSGTVAGGIALIGAAGKGTWEYSIDGTIFKAVGTVSGNSALLLASNAVLRYTPDGKNGETPTITYRAWDTTSGVNETRVNLSSGTAVGGATAFSTATDTGSLTVTAVNDAPVLASANPSLGSTNFSTATTMLLTAFINHGTGTSSITDVDSGAAVGGIALTGATGKGTWAYSLDGATFLPVSTVTDSSALLLPSSAKLRYTPDGSTVETATITYRAWDATTGTSGSHVSTATNGGGTAFSSATDSARLTVASGSVSGYVYLDSNNDGQKAASESGLAGITVRLKTPGSGDNWTQTDAAGLYSFQCLAAATYGIEVVPSSKLLVGQKTLGTVAGTSRGTVVQNGFQLPLAGGESGSGYNIAVLGLKPALVSLRLFLASTPPMPKVIQNIHAVPSVSLNTTNTAYVAGDSPLAFVSSASISSPDSPTLTSMTVTIQNLSDGSSEQLQAATSGTSLTSAYSNGVLHIAGVADAATCQTVLKSLTYSNTAASPTIANRTISVVVNDGMANSDGVTATVVVKQRPAVSGNSIMADQTTLDQTAPIGYSITADQATLDATTATSAGFTFANAEVGATYSCTISSSHGGTALTGNGTITSPTQHVSGINVSSLTDGLLTFTVLLTDAAGNIGDSVTTTTTLERTE